MTEYSPITIARFWSKVDVRPNDIECWNWKGATKGKGYGRLKVGGTCLTASRIAWELSNGESLGDQHALHSCDNPRCCNPSHITRGDHAQNMREAKERGLFNPPRRNGEKNPNARLSGSDVTRIRQMIMRGMTNIAIAKKFDVSHSMISRIRRGRSWQNAQGTNKERTKSV